MVELFSLLRGIPDVPGKILGPKDDCTHWDCLQFTLLLPENWLNGVKLVVCWIVKFCLLWSPKIVTALKGICHLTPSCGF